MMSRITGDSATDRRTIVTVSVETTWAELAIEIVEKPLENSNDEVSRAAFGCVYESCNGSQMSGFKGNYD